MFPQIGNSTEIRVETRALAPVSPCFVAPIPCMRSNGLPYLSSSYRLRIRA